VWVSVSIQIFALTADGNLRGEKNYPGGGMSEGEYVRGGNVQGYISGTPPIACGLTVAKSDRRNNLINDCRKLAEYRVTHSRLRHCVGWRQR